MEKIIFECETITPMFISGADISSAELRAPSIKGLLRYWWRAINPQLSLEDLKEKESKIFGGSGEKDGKSQVIIRIQLIDIKESKNDFPQHDVNSRFKQQIFMNVLNYLAFGPVRGMKVNRKYINIGSIFNIIISFNDSVIKKETIIDLIYMIGYLGGLGSKSRNGFGRFMIKSIKDLTGLLNFSFDAIIENIKNFNNERRSYTSFSKETKILRSKVVFETWDKALADIGKKYKNIREHLDKDKHIYDKRKYISSPIMDGRVNKSFLERHSKDYFLSVIKDKNKFKGYIFFLPYLFLDKYPDSNNISLKDYDEVNKTFITKLQENMEEVK